MKKLAILFTIAMAGTPAIADQCDKDQQIRALALNMYHEARGEGADAMQMLGEVTLNRVANPHFPNNICSVVYQARFDRKGNPIRHQCQFSWFCDGRSDRARNEEYWNTAKELATGLVEGTIETFGIDATHYHTKDVSPYWADRYALVGQYGNHLFYHMGDRL